MSRTRKGGKYKGGSMASAFKQGVAMSSPIYEVVVANPQQMSVDDAPPSELFTSTEDLPSATQDNLNSMDKPIDEVGKKQGSSTRMSSRKEWMNRSKTIGEEAKAEAEREAAAEAEKQRLLDEYTAKGYTDDYEEGMEKYEIRQESKENKKEIKDDYKVAKSDLKAKKKSGELSKKDYKAQKKAAKKAKKDAKKKNKEDKKKAKANRKRK